MRSNLFRLNDPVSSNVCHYCHKPVVGGTSRTVLDDEGSLAITAWTCGSCGSVSEEIGLVSEDGHVRRRPNRYVIARAASAAMGRGASRVHGELRH